MQPLLTSIPLGVVLVSLMTLGPNGTRADELPTDADKIESLTPDHARALVEEFPGVDVHLRLKSSRHSFHKSLPLNGLKTLDAATARALSNYHGPLILGGLATLDAEILEAFKKPGTGGDYRSRGEGGFDWFRYHEGSVLHVDGLKTLDAKTATALVDVWGHRWSGILSHLEKLDIDTAKVLAGFRGDLVLDGLPALDADVATVLVAGDRVFLGLDGLKMLNAETAEALAGFKGEFLCLNGLTTLDAETAEALAGFKGQALFLAGLTTFDSPDSVAVAQALAQRQGQLSLPSLKKLSPKTLSALLKKEDIEIPLTETLELIPEPDGSITEDFIVPEWLGERESRLKEEQKAKRSDAADSR